MNAGQVTECPQPQPAAPAPETGGPSGGLAIASFVLGILAVVLGVIVIGGILGMVGILLGMAHLLQHRSRRGYAGWGIGLSLVGMLMAAAVLILCVKAYKSHPYMRSHSHSLSAQVRQKIANLKGADASRIYESVLSELSAGRQSDAEDILDAFVERHANDQRLAFAQAVCSRSRWSKDRAGWQFRRVLEMNPVTPEANVSRYVLDLDERRNVEKNMDALRFMTTKQPENPLFLWLMAIECREHYKLTGETTYSVEATQCYRTLLTMWETGPVLVHQTFANVLSEELGLDEEALAHRRLAVQLEPKSWNYQGLANTLSSMKRYDEANEAYAKLVELDPNDAMYWDCWANSLQYQDRHEECIEKCKRALAVDPSYFESYNKWGYALEQLGRYDEAMDVFDKAIKLNPTHEYAYTAQYRILKSLGKTNEARVVYMKWANMLQGKLRQSGQQQGH